VHTRPITESKKRWTQACCVP